MTKDYPAQKMNGAKAEKLDIRQISESPWPNIFLTFSLTF